MDMSGFQEELIIWLQGGGEWLMGSMRFFSFLGDGPLYVLIAAFIYWCVDRRFGARVFLVLIISAGVNSLLKGAIHAPRPYWVNEQITGVTKHASFGMPSGHSQSAASFMSAVAATVQVKWVYFSAAFFILLVGFSRIVMGVHYPSQVLVGFSVGLLVTFSFLNVEERIARLMDESPLGIQIGAVLGFSAIILGFGVLLFSSLSHFRFPSSWVENAPDSFSARNLATPISLSNVISTMGAICGFGLGLVLEKQKGGHSTEGSWRQKSIRMLLGSAVLFGLWKLPGLYRPEGHMVAHMYLFLGATLPGFWISGPAPLLFGFLERRLD